MIEQMLNSIGRPRNLKFAGYMIEEEASQVCADFSESKLGSFYK